jgi:hypothetical protein
MMIVNSDSAPPNGVDSVSDGSYKRTPSGVGFRCVSDIWFALLSS